jgi:hypothetical protein
VIAGTTVLSQHALASPRPQPGREPDIWPGATRFVPGRRDTSTAATSAPA